MFPCTKCGICCENVDKHDLYKQIHHIDGVCVYFNTTSKLCNIYKQRPLICRISDFYDTLPPPKISKKDFYALNVKACTNLQKQKSINH